MTTVRRACLSWVSSRALPTRVLSGEGNPALARQWTYTKAFQAVDPARARWWRRSGGRSRKWLWPWADDVSYSNYWRGNLGASYRSGRNPDRAWKRVVPLRAAEPPVLATTVGGVTMACDQYLFPSGVAVMVRADIDGELASTELLKAVDQLGRRPVVSFGDAAPQPVTAVVGRALDHAERAVFGDLDPESVETQRPETVAAVVATTGAPLGPVTPGSPAHRLLSGLCQLRADVPPESLGVLDQDLLKGADRHQETARLQIREGRAIWSPQQSNDWDGARRLECYHSNVALSTMAVDLMLNTTRWAHAVGWRHLPQPGSDVLAPQLNMLGLMYGRTDVYTTRFVRRQIESSGLVAAISDLRVRLGVGQPLS